MFFTAKLNNLIIAPRKVRIIANMIRGEKAVKARAILKFTVKKSAPIMLKLLDSAISSANVNSQVKAENLYISKIIIDEGRKLKRWMPRARGSASPIQKKTSHITLVLQEIVQSKESKVKKPIKSSKKPKAVKEEANSAIREKLSFEREETSKFEKNKPRPEIKAQKPKIEKGFRKIFARKAI